MIFVKQGDRKPAAPATIKRGDDIVSLADATSVTFKARHMYSQAITVEGTATILVAASGTVEYRWAVNDTDDAGDYYVSWVVLWNDGTEETFPTISFDVLRIDPNIEG